ncbi:sarcosine oxidase subunit gamma [Rhizorhabdus dicambivorans]|nr:sarcosine oxidase subunit gamma family protein [Rhizorhabdus dicambivorans]
MADDFALVERSSLGLATVMARKDISAADIGRALGMPMPDGPFESTGVDMSLLGTGPGSWLALCEKPGEDWADGLAAKLDGLASLSDQSGAYVVFRLGGARARRLLQQGVALDLDPEVFPPHRVAVTMIAHIGVILWRCAARDAFDVAIFRSFATSFRQWATATAAHLIEA